MDDYDGMTLVAFSLELGAEHLLLSSVLALVSIGGTFLEV